MDDKRYITLRIPLKTYAPISELLPLLDNFKFVTYTELPVSSIQYSSIDEEEVLSSSNKESPLYDVKMNFKTKEPEQGLPDLIASLNPESDKINQSILLNSKLKRLKTERNNQLIKYDDFESQFAKIHNAYLYMIDDLSPQEIKIE